MSTANDLSGTPFGLNAFDDGRPVLRGILKVSSRLVWSGDGVLLGLVGSAGAVGTGEVSLNFSNDCRGMSVENRSDAASGIPRAEQAGDGVPFIFGALVASLVVTPILTEEDAGSITGSPSVHDRGVALSLADRVA